MAAAVISSVFSPAEVQVNMHRVVCDVCAGLFAEDATAINLNSHTHTHTHTLVPIIHTCLLPLAGQVTPEIHPSPRTLKSLLIFFANLRSFNSAEAPLLDTWPGVTSCRPRALLSAPSAALSLSLSLASSP